ncbi:alcohol acetyltransferase [Aspergillus taichungensis]|uniref:Alcohol acetyltransferase n=1 Tax=Aspergillus taichungensis TaxID=482145 RepID=A0A2J5I8E7_9EURO|nr:alcohol acetyltransferase [Aspergillus taichungensis]
MDKLEKLRPVGRLEQCSTARHSLGFYNNVAVTASYTLPGPFTLPVKDYIYKACEILISQHPVLSAIPIGEDTKEPYFARLPEIDLSTPVSFQERTGPFPRLDEADSELDAVLQAQHNTPFEAPSPHWRLHVLTDPADNRRFTAVFVFHHAIGDGTSGKAFHRTFLQAMRSTASLAPGEAQQLIRSPQSPLLPNVEELHTLPLSIPFLAGALFREKIWSSTDPGLWAGSEVRLPLETNVRHVVIPKPVASSFKDSCRREATTITAALQTLVARAILTHVPNRFTSVHLSGAMSTRRWMPDTITDDSIGVWVQDYSDEYTRQAVTSEAFPWAEAKRSRETIERVLQLKGKNAGPNLLKYVGDFHEELYRSKVGKHRKASFEVSNIGALGVGEQEAEQPQVGRVVFSQSASVTGSAIEVSVASGGDGCLVLAFTWQTDVVDSTLMSSIIDQATGEVHGACAL